MKIKVKNQDILRTGIKNKLTVIFRSYPTSVIAKNRDSMIKKP
jgi:hypothetical protein